MAAMTAGSMSPVGGEYPWTKNAHKLHVWFRALLILLACWTVSLFVRLPDLLIYIASFCLVGALIASIGCIVYAYRVQSQLNRLGLARTGAWVIVVGPFLLSPMLVGIIASIAVLSSVKTIRKRLEDGSLVMPQIPPHAS